MTEREDKVYQAKLAEQAERYDGKIRFWLSRTFCILRIYYVKFAYELYSF
jgi:hypothetical protein